MASVRSAGCSRLIHGTGETAPSSSRAMSPVTRSARVRTIRSTIPAYAVGGYDVVGVGEREQVAGRVADALVARRAEALVGGVDDADPFVAGGHGLGEVARPVGGAVVDDDHLEAAVSLRQQALEALHDVRLHVVDRDDDADQGRGPAPHGAHCTHGRPALLPR